jgi:hypothetical protein
MGAFTTRSVIGVGKPTKTGRLKSLDNGSADQNFFDFFEELRLY